MSGDSGQGESFCTPRRAQKRLFGPVGSSTKRSLFHSQSNVRKNGGSSGDESDLGPMSPLALTDQSPSSCDSSPGRQFVSPLATPSPRSSHSQLSWDRLTSSRSGSNEQTSPFSELRKSTRAARCSPRRRIFPNSRSPSCSPVIEMSKPLTPTTIQMTMISDEIVPQTPQRSFGREIQNDIIVETPQKSDDPEHRLITPLGSACKMALLPRLNRRKSIGPFDVVEGFSTDKKENPLKRHAHEISGSTGSKLFKTDETCSMPKARAALFQEKKAEDSLRNFTLSTKTFYGNVEKRSRPMSFSANMSKENAPIKKRRSLPVQSNKRSFKKHKYGGINAGVFHGIRKPKPRASLDSSKRKVQQSTDDSKNLNNSLSSKADSKEMDVTFTNEKQIDAAVGFTERAASPEIDPNKRFFKTNRTIKQSNVATVTVNNKIKLTVTGGKIALNQQRATTGTNVHKRPRLMDISFDATDLTVDAPEVEASIEENKVANILKILEDDWADDDYDTMEMLTNQSLKTVISPLKSVALPKDITMSPASELSNMTSTMNIKDISAAIVVTNNSINETDDNDNNLTNKESGEKYYPLFSKGYTPKVTYEEAKPVRGIKRCAKWQLSAKAADDENQYQLDVGQKHFGATQCTECNVVYQLGDPYDENAHLNYHNSVKILKFSGWKTERVIAQDFFTQSRIILVDPEDSKRHWNKVTEILEVVDRDLGLADMKLTDYQDKKIYLYIRDKSVIGVLVAEYVNSAHRMIPELIELNCCTAESTPAKCGINVVWTAMSHRRQGIATKLVNTLRTKFFYGYIMSLDDIAFSIPTPSGKLFAEKYTGTKNFKVYN